GWREVVIGTGQSSREEWQAQGQRIGWVKHKDVYLEPEAAYAQAQRLASEQGESLAINPLTLRKRLNESGLLASTDTARGVLTVRRTLEGRRREVIHLLAALFLRGKPDQPDQLPGEPEENGRVDGRESPGPAADPTSEPDQNGEETGQVVGLVGSGTG